MSKHVRFDLNKNTYNETYHKTEYDRSQIDHVLYRKAYQKLSNEEFSKINVLLDLYKLYEMPVHKESFANNYYMGHK
jgi:hypothetical protein